MIAIAVATFLVSMILLIFDWIDKTIIALTGALILILFKVLTWQEAIQSIDFETITLLLGLMFVVAISQHSGIFSWLNVQIAKKSKGSPLAVFLLFSALTFFASTVLNNATVVLLIIPVALSLASGLGLNSKLLVIGLAIFSNIGGTLTLIGDPPNTLIGVQAGLSFGEFVMNLAIPIVAITIIIVGYFIATNWSSLRPISKNIPKLFVSNMIIQRICYQYAAKKLDKFVIATTCLALFATVVAFVFQPQLALSVGVIGMASGIFLSLILSKKIQFLGLIKEVEWDSLLFFAGLFIQVGALEKVGALSMIANFIASFSGNYVVLLMVIVWGIGLASSFINNIPLIALMIPVIFDIQSKLQGQPHLDLLWWALALGGCLGGNGTIIGSSSGILAIDAAKKYGIKISFMDFFKVGMPVTLISLTVASIYLLIRVYS